jgi:sporadic carbohydrate cluster 2OG-Fe(II) oxygenase
MPSFISPDEQALCDEFLSNGIVKVPVENMELLAHIQRFLCENSEFANGYHLTNDPLHLNEFRMKAIRHLNYLPSIRKDYYSLAKNALHTLVGNELVMQRNINLSIQLPNDDSSLLPIHADSLQGDSPYEVVLWVPLVDCYDSKSMFFTRKQPTTLAGKSLEDLYNECEPYFVDVKYGECLIFSQNWFHGNRVNETNETRWSLNCRFKSALSPYSDKKLGEFFEPITIRPATKLGMQYVAPSI